MPNYKTAILFSLLLFNAPHLFGQSFKADWKSFKPPINWTVNFVNKNESYLGHNTQGALDFKNEVDTNLKIRFVIYLDFEVDSNFKAKIKHDQFIKTTISTVKFESFTQNGFYYLALPANNCLTSIIGSRPINAKDNVGKKLNNCELLAFEISKFTKTKTNKF